jgi:hypothetical protein
LVYGGRNDPDYVQIGWIGSADKQGIPELTRMPAAMKYAYLRVRTGGQKDVGWSAQLNWSHL